MFDFDRSVFRYLNPRPVEYYFDKELVDNYNSDTIVKTSITCPNCKDENVNYGYAIDVKWNILYLIFSILIYAPFPLIRKNYHCFKCKFDFKYIEMDTTKNNS